MPNNSKPFQTKPIGPQFYRKPFAPILESTRTKDAVLVALNILPISTPHRDLDHLPLADKYFQIKDTFVQESPLKLLCRYKDQYLNHADYIRHWELGLPKYQFPKVHIFPEILHYCHMNYDPSQRAVRTLDQSVLFTITTESINEMLQLQPSQTNSYFYWGFTKQIP